MANNQPVGVMQIVLTSNNANFSQGIAEAQRKLDAFAKTATGAGHSTVSSMQAASASIRLLENPLGNNIRSIERLISQSKVLSGALQAAFPIVGGIALASILAKLGGDVIKFIKNMQEMPRAITQGFDSLNLASKTSIDQLQLTNDKLDNLHAKFERKPQNNQKIAIDEARLAMDRFAESIENGNSKLGDLLSKSHLSAWHELLFTASTNDREGTAKAFAFQLNKNAFDAANAEPGSPEQAKAKKDTIDTLNAQIAEARRDLVKQQNLSEGKDTRAVQADDMGIITDRLNQLKKLGAEEANAAQEAQHQKDDAAKAETEAAKQAAHERIEAYQTALDASKLQFNLSIKAVFDYWERMKAAERAGGTAYNEIVKKQSEIAVEGARQAAEKIARFKERQLSAPSVSEGSEIAARGMYEIQREKAKAFGEQNEDYIDTNELSIVNAHNEARQREAQITDEAGKSMSRYAVAVELAKVHAEEYLKVMQSLQAILGVRQMAFSADPSRENRKALEQAQAQLSTNQSQHTVQVQGDLDNIYGRQTTAAAGAADALRDFMLATRDAYSQMRNLITTTQATINEQIVRGISGQRTDFGNAGAGIFRSVANTGLQKAEGSVLGMFSLGSSSRKPIGSKSDPIFVQMATITDVNNKLSQFGPISSFTGLFSGSKSTDGGSDGVLSSLLGKVGATALGTLPMLAGGGALGPDQWAIVGEKGPELFHSGGGGTVVPNSKISQGGDTHHYNHFDARGAVDPEQTKFAMRQAIQEAAPHLIAGSVRAVGEHRLRRPSTSR